ncbi:unnamed protein product [Nezara viridula]|uniref:APCDD1 domain-containing protein n=1 Tax=Nezara viridula TaxID=85310 RepID=A0A9P0MM85_NEZVI|nr:unnamed protein product [Nezara viridula]
MAAAVEKLPMCETKTLIGPEYLLRSIAYTDNETYVALLHRYRDPFCSVPWISSSSKGRAGLRGRSWVRLKLPLALSTALSQSFRSAGYSHHHQVLSHGAADEISSQLNTTCPGLIKRRWRPHTDYTIYTSSDAAEGANDGTESLSGSVACLKPLKLPHEEAGVLRVQVRPPSPPHPATRRTELLLGETKPKGTVFQPPLLFAAQVSTS